VIALIEIAGQLLSDALRFAVLLSRPSSALVAENLFLRRQLALYKERGVRPRRIDTVTRMSLSLLSRLFDWRSALVVVRPEALIRWHVQVSGYFGAGNHDLDARRFRPNCGN